MVRQCADTYDDAAFWSSRPLLFGHVFDGKQENIASRIKLMMTRAQPAFNMPQVLPCVWTVSTRLAAAEYS